ncbi:MAG: cell division ATP-binding protein FtsE [Gammaproteobacteria bacterium]|nr:cell division ATP-binding protein FtsE [Gammaproteobacteria bacterium]
MLQFSQVYKRYPGGKDALKGVDFSLDAGEMTFITGHSGAGKSTFLKLIAAMEKPTRGGVLFDHRNLARLRRGQIPELRRKLGIIFQDYKLLHDRTVFDNVALPLLIAGLRRQEAAKRVRAALDKVGLLGKERLLPVTLSGGEQQRVGIARAVVHRPKLLLADEPTGNLDPALSAEIMDIFVEFQRVGVAVLVVSHDLPLVKAMGCRTVALSDGRLIEGLSA